MINALCQIRPDEAPIQGGFSVLLRVAHRFGVGEDVELSRPATVALSQLFTAAHLTTPKAVEEMSLSVLSHCKYL